MRWEEAKGISSDLNAMYRVAEMTALILFVDGLRRTADASQQMCSVVNLGLHHVDGGLQANQEWQTFIRSHGLVRLFILRFLFIDNN